MPNTRHIEDINRSYKIEDIQLTQKRHTKRTVGRHSVDRQRTDKDHADNIQITQRG